MPLLQDIFKPKVLPGKVGEKSCLDPIAELHGRTKYLGPRFSYKFSPDSFGIDTPLTDEPKFDEKAFSITFPFAASQGRDRVGDFMEVAGIELGNHRMNPVAFVDHGKWHPLPIGKCVSPDGQYTVTIDAERGLAECTVYLAQGMEVPAQVFELYRQKILRAGSLGYRIIEAQRLPPDPEQGLKGGLHLIRVELLEPSITGLPVNQDCARKAIGMTFGGKSLHPALRASFEHYAGPAPVWANGWTADGVKDITPSMSAVDITAGGGLVPGGRTLPRRTLKRKRDTMSTTAKIPGAKKKDAFDGAPSGPAATPTTTTMETPNSPEADAGNKPEEGTKVPHGAQLLGDIYGVLEMVLHIAKEEEAELDNGDVRAALEKILPDVGKACEAVKAAFEATYPDLEPLESDLVKAVLGKAEEGPEEKPEAKPEEEGKKEEDEDDEAMKGGRKWPRKSLFPRKNGSNKAAGTIATKAMSKSQMSCVKDAAEFLEEHGAEDNLTKRQKAAVMYHAKALGDLSASKAADEPEDDLSDDEKALILRRVETLGQRAEALELSSRKALGQQ